LDVEEEFAHGSDDGGFAGLTAGEETFDVIGNDGVAARG
jgi:hypothetical protein